MNATHDVTRYATGCVHRTCVIPTDPTRTEPALLQKQRGETFTTSFRNVTREATATAVAPPRDDVVTGSSTIEGVDLDAEVPCEAKQCDSPADYRVRHTCPDCGYQHPGAVGHCCATHWEGRNRAPRRCRSCHEWHPHGDAWRIVEVLR